MQHIERVHVCLRTHVCVCVCVCVCVRACVHACMHFCMYVCVCSRMGMELGISYGCVADWLLYTLATLWTTLYTGLKNIMCESAITVWYCLTCITYYLVLCLSLCGSWRRKLFEGGNRVVPCISCSWHSLLTNLVTLVSCVKWRMEPITISTGL